MNITYQSETKTFQLDTPNTSYIMALADDQQFLGHVYYGPLLQDDDVSFLMRTGEYPFTPCVNARERGSFLDLFPTEITGNCVGDFRNSSIEVLDRDGHGAVQFYYQSHKIYSGKPALEGLPATFGSDTEVMTLEIHTMDPVLSLEAILYYSVFADCDAIARSVTLVNHAENLIQIKKIMSVCLDMDDEEYQLLTLHGSWARERQIEFRTIGHGSQGVSSFRGESSHQEHPFLGLVQKNATNEQGKVYGFHFVYSGNFHAEVSKNQFDSLRVLMGIHPKNFSFSLGKGERFVAPECILVFSEKGLGGMSRNYHDLYRNHLIRSSYKDKERPVLINNWEATYFDFDSEKLLSIARTAKEQGIEMLVMDDGWFGKRDDDNSSLGDWRVNENKIKGGLKKLVEEVNQIGLKFGIWFEPEMVCPDSELYRKHPDWALAIDGRVPCRLRNQFVLDFSNPEVVDYVYECVANILRSANIEYVKWDMNRQLTDVGSHYLSSEKQGEIMHRHVLAVYELQERLLSEFPNLLLENCSGGGARFDPGMLYYSPQIWCSDDTDAIERLSIQEGTSLLYPLSTMGAHVSDCPNHLVGRVTPFSTRGNVALAGTFGYELDITKISREDREQIPTQIEMYHKYHSLIRSGDYYRIASFRENYLYDAYEVVSKDQSWALITYVQVRSQANQHSKKLLIPGLSFEKVYQVDGYEKPFHGDTLAKAGILLPRLSGDYQSVLIEIREVK